ncbi:MAG TPA: hypothetical protein VHM90_01680 [Phycisphaerae bacterium]|nr:hypothetical protein [Phycisphaerae bacterium]
MKNVRVVVEFENPQTGARLMRWEHTAAAEAAAFELLGRAFEVAQREEAAAFPGALQAFLRGALLEKEDVIQALEGA